MSEYSIKGAVMSRAKGFVVGSLLLVGGMVQWLSGHPEQAETLWKWGARTLQLFGWYVQ